MFGKQVGAEDKPQGTVGEGAGGMGEEGLSAEVMGAGAAMERDESRYQLTERIYL